MTDVKLKSQSNKVRITSKSEKRELELYPSEMAQRYLKLEGDWFSLEDRDYLLPVYDGAYDRMILRCGRQTEKTLYENETVLNDYGERIPIKDVEVGDKVASMAKNQLDMTAAEVTWKSRRYRKECLKVTTEMNHTFRAGITHPIRQWDRWTEAQNLNVGDFVATVRNMECPSPDYRKDRQKIKILGYMLGDGSIGHTLGFYQKKETPALFDFKRLCSELGYTDYTERPKNNNDVGLRFSIDRGGLSGLMKEYGLWNKSSANKFIPRELMESSNEDIKPLIEALWACDGSVLTNRNTNYEITFNSISKKLVDQMQSLLWRFGIPSRTRSYEPEAYEGTDKDSWLLTVRTRKGIDKFLRTFHIPGKNVQPPECDSNDNRDVIPKEAAEGKFRKLHDTRNKAKAERSLRQDGLRIRPKYNVTWGKLDQYIEHFETAGGYDQKLVEDVKRWKETDLYWDKIKKIESMGEQWCYDIEVDRTNNFIVNGVVTHNSTTIANLQILRNLITEYHKTLYVSTSQDQMQKFSNGRLERMLKDSPYIYDFYYRQSDTQNVKEKHFTNGSVFHLSYAGDDADRIRGMSADDVFIDEFQDIMEESIPIIEEVTSHAPDPHFVYAGTPKSEENVMETYWDKSTQHEWVVQCTGCNKYNILGLSNIGKTGPICSSCGKDIHPLRDGQWTWMRDPDEVRRFGFRISQLMVPWKLRDEEAWNDLLYRIEEEYSMRRTYNEVLGLPYSVADQPLTEDELKQCTSNYNMSREQKDYIIDRPVFMGVDIGSGEAGELGEDAKSFTSVSIMYKSNQDRWRVEYLKRYEGLEADPEKELNDIKELARLWDVDYIGIDWGYSVFHRPKLREAFGWQSVVPIFYVNNLREPYTWDDKGLKFRVSRPETLTELFNDVKNGGIQFPNYEESGHLLDDFLSIHMESDGRGRIRYVHPDNQPDDVVHACNYARIVGSIYHSSQRQELQGYDEAIHGE